MDYKDYEAFENYDFEADAREKARQFEEMLQQDQKPFLDPSAIEDLFSYYLFQSMESDKALMLISYALDQFPLNSDLYYKKSMLLHDAGKISEAHINIEKALEISPVDMDYQLQMVNVLNSMDKFQQALEILGSLLDSNLDRHEEIYFFMGTIYSDKGDPEKAIGCYRKALVLDPELIEALQEMVFCFERCNRSEDAIIEVERYLDENPYETAVWLQLGVQYMRVGHFEKAIEAFDYCIAIDSQITLSYAQKANALVEIGKYREAISCLFELLKYDSNDANAYFLLGECFEGVGIIEDALRYYHKGLGIQADYTEGWYNIGYLLEREDRFKEACFYYRKALALDAVHAESWIGITNCEIQLGNEKSAMEALEEAIDLNYDDFDMWAEWAYLFKKLNRLDAALLVLEKGLDLNKDMAELFYLMSGYSILNGNISGGLVYLENGLLLNYKKHPVLLDVLGDKKQNLDLVHHLIEHYKN